MADNSTASLDKARDAFQETGYGDDRLMATLLDVRDAGKVDEWVKGTVERFGRLDGGANLAGVIREFRLAFSILASLLVGAFDKRIDS